MVIKATRGRRAPNAMAGALTHVPPIDNLHVIPVVATPAVDVASPYARVQLIEIHKDIHRVTGAITLAYKNGPTVAELKQWAEWLRMCADKLDPPV